MQFFLNFKPSKFLLLFLWTRIMFQCFWISQKSAHPNSPGDQLTWVAHSSGHRGCWCSRWYSCTRSRSCRGSYPDSSGHTGSLRYTCSEYWDIIRILDFMSVEISTYSYKQNFICIFITFNQCCGSKYIEFGSGSMAQFVRPALTAG